MARRLTLADIMPAAPQDQNAHVEKYNSHRYMVEKDMQMFSPQRIAIQARIMGLDPIRDRAVILTAIKEAHLAWIASRMDAAIAELME